jgi:sugar phosphate isomerase/epimerase
MKTTQSRRNFLQVSAAGALGVVALSRVGKSDAWAIPATASVDLKSYGVGLQLYTIRDAMKTDVPGSLKRISDMGYKNLEMASYANGMFYGYKPEEFKKMVNDLGMDIISSHASVESTGITLDNAKQMTEDHVKVGVKYCVQPWVVEEARKTIDSYKRMVADWNKVGKIMRENGIQFGYHNHNFEFDTVEGKIPYYDIFMVELDKELVTMEMDLFWTTKAGQNPIEIFKKYPGRFQLLHFKDMYTKEAPFVKVASEDFAPVGAGLIDFKEILAAKNISGMKYFFVEQDRTKDGKPFDSIQTSITNLTTKILV